MAPGHASKAHRYFEKAVELDPKNLEAMNDLFEYYLEAPGFLGGGFDKAQALADAHGGTESGRRLLGAGQARGEAQGI